jgi:hypothetical protein
MPDLILKLSDEHLHKSKEEVSKILDEEVERFSTWLTKTTDFRAQGALCKPERALIKTYLLRKLLKELD